MSDALTLVSKAGSIYIICHMFRPGGLNFITELEHRHYPPGEELNNLITIYNVTYEGGPHYAIEIPAGKREYEQAVALAAEFNLKFVPGKPFNGRSEFPLQCQADKCFVLETADHSKECPDIFAEYRSLKSKYTA